MPTYNLLINNKLDKKRKEGKIKERNSIFLFRKNLLQTDMKKKLTAQHKKANTPKTTRYIDAAFESPFSIVNPN